MCQDHRSIRLKRIDPIDKPAFTEAIHHTFSRHGGKKRDFNLEKVPRHRHSGETSTENGISRTWLVPGSRSGGVLEATTGSEGRRDFKAIPVSGEGKTPTLADPPEFIRVCTGSNGEIWKRKEAKVKLEKREHERIYATCHHPPSGSEHVKSRSCGLVVSGPGWVVPNGPTGWVVPNGPKMKSQLLGSLTFLYMTILFLIQFTWKMEKKNYNLSINFILVP